MPYSDFNDDGKLTLTPYTELHDYLLCEETPQSNQYMDNLLNAHLDGLSKDALAALLKMMREDKKHQEFMLEI